LIRDRSSVRTEISEVLGDLAGELSELIVGCSASREHFFAHLVPQSTRIDNNQQLAAVVLTKTCGPSVVTATAIQFADLFSRLGATFEQSFPGVAGELAADSRTLREDWERSGKPLIETMGRITDPGLLVDRAEVILACPVREGGGRAHLLYNTVTIEAVGEDPIEDLPEVVRLAWLCSQLNADLPMYQDEVHRDRLVHVAALAMIPAVLWAAASLQGQNVNPRLVARAVELWTDNVESPEQAAETLSDWWQTYQSQKPHFRVALAALDRLLA
jgi:hypothetical protein